MDARQIRTQPDPYESFQVSQGFKRDGVVYLAGQASIDGEANVVGKDNFQRQAHQTFSNIGRLLEQSGSGMDKVFRATSYLTDMYNFEELLEIRDQYYCDPYPAETFVEVEALGMEELMLEIEVTAVTGEATLLEP